MSILRVLTAKAPGLVPSLERLAMIV